MLHKCMSTVDPGLKSAMDLGFPTFYIRGKAPTLPSSLYRPPILALCQSMGMPGLGVLSRCFN